MTKQIKPTIKPPKKGDHPAEKPIEPKKSTTQEKQAAIWQEKYVRVYAELENYKKRAIKEKFEWICMASEKIIMALLPIKEDLERALGDDQIDKQGIQIIYDKLAKVLLQQGLSAMQITQGDNFDPDYHEALTTAPVKDEKLKGKIVEIVGKGYLLNKKIIQIAKVIIGI